MRERLWFLLPLIGIALHLAFLALLRPAFDADWSRRSAQAETESELALLGDWEDSWQLTKLTLLPCVYGPAVLIAVIISGIRLLQQRESRFWSSVCIGLGVSSMVYLVLILSSL
jgi:hypothetical protein